MTLLTEIRNFLKENILKRITAGAMLIAVVVLCVVSLLFQYFRRPDTISPLVLVGAVVVTFQEGINEVGEFLFTSEQERLNLAEARARIEELEKENSLLRRELDDRLALSVENEELRALLLAKDRYTDYEMEEAQIIGNDGVNSFERFTINKGTADGIRVDMNVINEKGLVGIVTETGLNYSIVTAIIEDGMNVSVMTAGGHENCVVTGDLALKHKNTLRLDNALSDVDLSGGQQLVTAYISDKFLPNLPVGYAVDIRENEGGLTKSGFVRCHVDFSRLNEVLVIKTMREELLETEDAK